jgi:UDP-glucose 4-epimerase
MGVAPELEYAGGRRGWVGDSPLILLDTRRIRALGWAPEVTIEQAVVRTLEWFDANDYAWRERPPAAAARGAARERERELAR